MLLTSGQGLASCIHEINEMMTLSNKKAEREMLLDKFFWETYVQKSFIEICQPKF